MAYTRHLPCPHDSPDISQQPGKPCLLQRVALLVTLPFQCTTFIAKLVPVFTMND